MPQRVEFFFDLVSPYSYLAHGRLRRICEERGAELVLRPMLLGGVHKAVGLQAPIEIEPKRRHHYRDVERWAHYYGLPLRYPDPFPFRTLKTMRAAMFSEKRGDLGSFTREAFALYWEEGGAPKGREEADEDEPVAEVARRIGADPKEVLEGAAEPEIKEALRAATSEAVERGVFGAPTFFVGDEMFWGTTGCTSSRRRWTGIRATEVFEPRGEWLPRCSSGRVCPGCAGTQVVRPFS